jgi:DNA mismatch repair protein MutL
MPPALANQIAAGEVVERPASCVKELVENSLDAGARVIRVSLQEGGIGRIVVADDGVGMDPEDAVLAFARHATSKVVHPRDLFRITTLGFRGEALASIAAVARVTLQTRPHGAEHGVIVRVEGSDQPSAPEPVGMPPGTRIEVRDLFFNTPARLKYLRSVPTEQARSVEVVQRAAMARPDVSFVCETDGRSAFRTGGRGDLLEVLAVLWGVGEAEQLLRVEAGTPDYRVWGYVGRPAQSKASRSHGHLFVNGRPIRNALLHQAVAAAYGSRLMVHRHPVYALHVEMDPSLVDVNIHPHKSEVRFSEERDVAEIVRRAVAQALDRATLIPDARVGIRSHETTRNIEAANPSLARGARVGRQQALFPVSSSRPSPEVREALHRALQPVDSKQSELLQEGAKSGQDKAAESPVEPGGGGEDRVREVPPSERQDARSLGSVDGEGQESGQKSDGLPALRLVGQVLGTYVVAEAEDALYLVDQHAAHERVLYELFSDRLRQRSVKPMPLLTALTFRLLPGERAALEQCRDVLSECGFEVEDFGGSDVVVRTVPDVWEGLDIPGLAERLLRELPDLLARPDPRSALHEWLATRACKAAVKANMRLSEVEIQALLESLAHVRDPFHCPHGRPVFVRLTRRELDAQFRRIV